jgi:hypothetical protein
MLIVIEPLGHSDCVFCRYHITFLGGTKNTFIALGQLEIPVSQILIEVTSLPEILSQEIETYFVLRLGVGALDLRLELALLILYHLFAPLSLHDALISNILQVLFALGVWLVGHLLHGFSSYSVVIAVCGFPLVLGFKSLGDGQLIGKRTKV